MSDLNPRQFQQLQMFAPTREVVESVHKIDSGLFEDNESSTPAEQWADVREEKSRYGLDKAIAERKPIPPLRVQYDSEGRYEPELWDGHHRLRELEDAGHTEVPIWQSFNEYERDTGSDGGGYFGAPYWVRRDAGPRLR